MRWQGFFWSQRILVRGHVHGGRSASARTRARWSVRRSQDLLFDSYYSIKKVKERLLLIVNLPFVTVSCKSNELRPNVASHPALCFVVCGLVASGSANQHFRFRYVMPPRSTFYSSAPMYLVYCRSTSFQQIARHKLDTRITPLHAASLRPMPRSSMLAHVVHFTHMSVENSMCVTGGLPRARWYFCKSEPKKFSGRTQTSPNLLASMPGLETTTSLGAGRFQKLFIACSFVGMRPIKHALLAACEGAWQ